MSDSPNVFQFIGYIWVIGTSVLGSVIIFACALYGVWALTKGYEDYQKHKRTEQELLTGKVEP